MPYRFKVLALLFLLIFVMYLDRLCISVAGPRIQQELHLTPVRWGWVIGAFTIAYAAFRNSERRPWRPDRAPPRSDPHRAVVVRIHGGYGPGPDVSGPATGAISVRRRRSGLLSQ